MRNSGVGQTSKFYSLYKLQDPLAKAILAARASLSRNFGCFPTFYEEPKYRLKKAGRLPKLLRQKPSFQPAFANFGSLAPKY